mgnify:CR=1 FL=1
MGVRHHHIGVLLVRTVHGKRLVRKTDTEKDLVATIDGPGTLVVCSEVIDHLVQEHERFVVLDRLKTLADVDDLFRVGTHQGIHAWHGDFQSIGQLDGQWILIDRPL